jgi:hypothetical protein
LQFLRLRLDGLCAALRVPRSQPLSRS